MRSNRLGVVALVAASVCLGAVPAGAGTDGEQEIYESAADADPGLRLAVDDRLVDIGIAVECGGLDLSGRFVTRLRSGNRIRVRGERLSGSGTDVTEVDLDLDGRIEGSRFTGTATAEGRAFDNDGETGSCDDEFDWSARRVRGTEPGTVQAQIFLPGLEDGTALLAAAGHTLYAVSPDPDVIHAVDPDTNEVLWQEEVDANVDAVAGSGDDLWLLDSDAGTLSHFDVADREVVATIDVGTPPEAPEYPFEAGVVVTSGRVWATGGSGRELVEVDPASDEEVGRVDLDGYIDSVASNADSVFVNVVQVPLGVERTGDEPVELRRIEATTGTVAETLESDTSVDLEADRRYLWALELLEVVLRDADTLEGVNRAEASAFDAVAAAPGLWAVTDDGVTLFDTTTDVAGVVPAFGAQLTALTTGFGSVWMWDDAGDIVVRASAR